MKSVRNRIISFLVVAVIVAIGIFFITNRYKQRESTDVTDFNAPTMPVMFVNYNGTMVNKMFGYKNEITLTTDRDSLSLLLPDRTMTIQINPYGNEIDTVSYELTSLTDGSFVENGTLSNLQEDDNGFLSTSLTITTPILMEQEYSMKFILKTRAASEEDTAETYYYYTRVIQQTGTNLSEYLDFAVNFYTNCLDKNQEDTILSSIETNETNNSSTNFDDVTIESNVDMVTWGNLSPQLYMAAVPKIKELNDETASLVMDYILSADNGDGQTEYYHVTDYYRLHNNQGVMVMIDFSRDVEELFDPELPIYTSTGINLGVRNSNLEYVTSANEQYVAFVTSGELWLLNDDEDGSVTNVFSFRDGQTIDERTINDSHEIKICSVDDDGNVTFIVYGYMNNGDHEGQTGAVIYTYSTGENLLREQLFIPIEQGYEYMNYYLSSLTNVSDDGKIYMYTGQTLQTVDLEGEQVGVALDNINPECFATSDSQTYVAWMNEMEPYASSSITFFNVKTGEQRVISAGEGEKIKIIGFYGEDLVYGYASDADIITDGAGNTVFGMNRICIESAAGEILKTYQQDGSYITRLYWSEDHLELELSTRTETGFTYNGSDHIVSNTNGDDSEIVVVTEKDDRCSLRVILPFMKGSSGDDVAKDRSKYTINYKKRSAGMTIPDLTENQYLVYYGSGLQRIDTQVNNAIYAADVNGGIVLDGNQKYVYECGNWRETITLETENIPAELLNPVLDVNVIQSVLGADYKIMNYTGCSIESIRYQISRGYPVIAKYADDRTILLVGYDRFDNLWYYDPETGEDKAIGDIDAAAIFGNMGNVFISYIRTDLTSAEAQASVSSAEDAAATTVTVEGTDATDSTDATDGTEATDQTDDQSATDEGDTSETGDDQTDAGTYESEDEDAYWDDY